MRERAVAAAIHEAERVVADDVLREPDAARAKNAALVVEHDPRTEVNGLRLVHLGFDEAAGGLAVVLGIFLQFAFTGLVANRAVERVVDEQKFQDAFAHLLRRWRTRINFHAGRNRRGAGNRAAHCRRLVRQYLLRDLRCAVFVQHGFAVRPNQRQAELDEAHAAVARDRQLGMIAIVRHFDTGQRTGLQHRCGLQFTLPVRHQLRHFNLAPVHLDPDLLDRRGRGLGFGCCCCR